MGTVCCLQRLCYSLLNDQLLLPSPPSILLNSASVVFLHWRSSHSPVKPFTSWNPQSIHIPGTWACLPLQVYLLTGSSPCLPPTPLWPPQPQTHSLALGRHSYHSDWMLPATYPHSFSDKVFLILEDLVPSATSPESHSLTPQSKLSLLTSCLPVSSFSFLWLITVSEVAFITVIICWMSVSPHAYWT